MITFMSNIIIFTNRNLCRENFVTRIEKIAKAKPSAIVLREKDLSERQYTELAEKVYDICVKNDTKLILHNFAEAAIKLGIPHIHMPLTSLCRLTAEELSFFSTLGASCHSVEDAKTAQKIGCTYITAGHIFNTDCKKGTEGRGLSFLENVCGAVSIPVYAIGGINRDNFTDTINAGACGAVVMSGAMTCDNPQKYILDFKVNK